jgi:hypothetical protein
MIVILWLLVSQSISEANPKFIFTYEGMEPPPPPIFVDRSVLLGENFLRAIAVYIGEWKCSAKVEECLELIVRVSSAEWQT